MISDLSLLSGTMSDLNWLKGCAKEINEKYEGEFVAIKDKSIITFAPSVDIILRKLKEIGINEGDVIIQYITPKNQIIIL